MLLVEAERVFDSNAGLSALLQRDCSLGAARDCEGDSDVGQRMDCLERLRARVGAMVWDG